MRIIAHLDMDAFFAAVEERDKPRLKGLPIVVGADPAGGKGRGVVSTANYKAREYGIHSATPISKAWQLSETARKSGKPPAVFIGGNFGRYEDVSASVMTIIRLFAAHVEQAGIDEAYFDLSFCGSYRKAEDICRRIKQEIRIKENLTASAGIGPNKLIAKIASDFRKPDGLTVIGGENEQEAEAAAEKFLEPMSIRKIPGIGPKTESVFLSKKVFSIRELKNFSQGELYDWFGNWGLEIYEKVRGRDDSPLVEEWEAKSIGEQETFGEDTRDFNFITERLGVLCRSVYGRFKESGFESFKSVGVTVRFEDFENKSRMKTLDEKSSSVNDIIFESLKLITPFFDRRENPQDKNIRLIGVKIEKLS